VAKHAAPAEAAPAHVHHHACPGSMAMSLRGDEATRGRDPRETHGRDAYATTAPSRLGNWPVQLMLAPVEAPFFEGADLLISADCVPYALANFHDRLLAGKVVLVGCPKLDDAAFYAEKLTAILQSNSIRSITVAHMEVPCCNGIVYAVRQAMEKSGQSDIAFRDITVGIRGEILSDHLTAPVGEGAKE
jgi:hypothetical protein